MYYIETQTSFDSAHFLAGYQGKCGNIHGHRWTVKLQLKGERLEEESTQTRGMVMDFKDVKQELTAISDFLDHCLIIEKGTMAEDTFACLKRDGFRIVEMDFRPTAENFARWFYDSMAEKGFPVEQVSVYETPNNCAIYRQG